MKTKTIINEITMTVEEIETAIQSLKPEFLHDVGQRAKFWFSTFWKHANIVVILKPEKSGDDLSHYRPISLLCVLFQLLERILLRRTAESIWWKIHLLSKQGLDQVEIAAAKH